MSKKNKLDQYYTKPVIADKCLDILLDYLETHLGTKDYSFVEPSAGTGSFLREGLKWEAYDLEPKAPCIIKRDFFTVEDLKGKIVVGNPPFGFASSLALKFLNHCAEHEAKVVAFILPKTFKKTLFQDKVSGKLHLIEEVDLPKDSFLLDGEEYDVPCVFQVWESRECLRDKSTFNKYFTKGSEDCYDFLLRRVGGRAGKILKPCEFTASSSLYVKGDVTFITKYQEEILEQASYTAGVKSITLDEINLIITKGENN